jgi:hypothetical protein
MCGLAFTALACKIKTRLISLQGISYNAMASPFFVAHAASPYNQEKRLPMEGMSGQAKIDKNGKVNFGMEKPRESLNFTPFMLFCCEHRKQQVQLKRKNSLGLSLGLSLTREREESSRAAAASPRTSNYIEKVTVEEDPYAVPAGPSEEETSNSASGKVLATMWASLPTSKKRKYGAMCGSYKEWVMKQLDGREEKKVGRRKKDPLAPKAPSSAYMYFAKHHRPKFKHKYSEATFGDLGKLVGALWKNATDDQKRPFIKQADADKQRYMSEMEDYKKILQENSASSPRGPSPVEASSTPSTSFLPPPMGSAPSTMPMGLGGPAFGMAMGMGLKNGCMDERVMSVSMGMSMGLNMGVSMGVSMGVENSRASSKMLDASKMLNKVTTLCPTTLGDNSKYRQKPTGVPVAMSNSGKIVGKTLGTLGNPTARPAGMEKMGVFSPAAAIAVVPSGLRKVHETSKLKLEGLPLPNKGSTAVFSTFHCC